MVGDGEKVGLIGRSGGGKTTITKLLARLYDPTEGCITLDGRDIKEYDVASLRAAISVIFQDFVRYDLALDANIGVGEIATVEDYLDAAAIEGKPPGAETRRRGIFARLAGKNGDVERIEVESVSDSRLNPALAVPQAIVIAAEKSLAATLLPRLPGGYRQMLGRRFDGGVDLSGGEWQKVALGRAYMRDAQLLILDEPTAALDARAEFEVFERFSELAHGRMAILISHRFSTVRMADRIVVLKDGSIVEQGTHDELAAGEGVYAELFRLQAAGYK